jgi:hypothetical protein
MIAFIRGIRTPVRESPSRQNRRVADERGEVITLYKAGSPSLFPEVTG